MKKKADIKRIESIFPVGCEFEAPCAVVIVGTQVRQYQTVPQSTRSIYGEDESQRLDNSVLARPSALLTSFEAKHLNCLFMILYLSMV